MGEGFRSQDCSWGTELSVGKSADAADTSVRATVDYQTCSTSEFMLNWVFGFVFGTGKLVERFDNQDSFDPAL